MTFLYTKNGCPGCAKAREFLASRGEEYKEVIVDNPLLVVGMEKLLKKDRIFVPLLVRANGKDIELSVPIKGADGVFCFIKVAD